MAHRQTQIQKCWGHDYLFTEVDSNAICLVCKQKVAVLKEYNIRRHYETKHSHQFAKYTSEDRKVKVANLLMKLDTQQQTLLQPSTAQENTTLASYSHSGLGLGLGLVS